MPTVKADVTLCEGYGNCVVAAPEFFDLDDQDVVVLLQANVDQADVARVQDAALTCPVRALRIETG